MITPFSLMLHFSFFFNPFIQNVKMFNQAQFSSETLWWHMPDFSNHLVCSNPASLLQSRASSHSVLPRSNCWIEPGHHPLFFSFFKRFHSDVSHNIEEKRSVPPSIISKLEYVLANSHLWYVTPTFYPINSHPAIFHGVSFFQFTLCKCHITKVKLVQFRISSTH